MAGLEGFEPPSVRYAIIMGRVETYCAIEAWCRAYAFSLTARLSNITRSPCWSRSSDLTVNSRSLCQLS